MKVTKSLLVLFVTLSLFIPASALVKSGSDSGSGPYLPNFTVTASGAIDNSFQVMVRSDLIKGVRGIEFVLDFDPNVVEVAGVSTTGLLASSSANINAENKVVAYSPNPVDISGDILILNMIAQGSAGESSLINLTNITVSNKSIGASKFQVISPGVMPTTVTLSSCVDYPNTHTGEGQQIPGTDCACSTGSSLVISPTTQKWACDITNATELFNNAQDCSLGGDPIYNTGYCCEEGYQLNQSFNNFDDLLGNPNQACTLIPNSHPTANIHQPPAEVLVGNITEFSSLGSVDSDGNLEEYDWDFGDNTTHSNLADPSHIYNSVDACPGSTCTVTLIVTDDDGATGKYTTSLTLISIAGAETAEPVCGNNIVEAGEVCDGTDDIACENRCNLDCSGCIGQPSLSITIGKTYAPSELADLGLTLGAETQLSDGRIVIVNAAGTITDIRAESSPPLTSVCGDGVCDIGEDSAKCLQDCHFGDGVCQKVLGESTDNAPLDCPKSKTPVFLFLIIGVGLLGGGILVAIKKGWISMGPIMHHSFEGPSGGPGFDLNRLAEQHDVSEPHNDLGKLSNYIRATRSQGFSFSQIKNNLMKKGWKEAAIDSAFSKTA